LKSSENYIKEIVFLVACILNKKYGSKGTFNKSSAFYLCVVSGCSYCRPRVCHNCDIRGFTLSRSKFWYRTLQHTAPTSK